MVGPEVVGKDDGLRVTGSEVGEAVVGIDVVGICVGGFVAPA